MADASSVVSVAIVGDSKKFQRAVGAADKSAKGFGTSVKKTALGIGGAVAGLFAVSKAFDFVGGAINEADRLGDATSNLNRIIGSVNTAKLTETADDFLKLGLSTQDVLELSVGFARIARAAGLNRGKIAKYADDVSATAQALSLVDEKGRDASAWVEIIGRAISKPLTVKSLKDLGINLKESKVITEALATSGKKSADSLSKQELAAARLKLIMEKLKPVLKDAIANPDLEAKQKEAGARLEELQGKLGVAITPALTDILTWLLKIADEIPGWAAAFQRGVGVVAPVWNQFVADISEDVQQMVDGFNTFNADVSDDIQQISDFLVSGVQGWQMLGDAIVEFSDTSLGPLGKVKDVLNDILDLMNLATGFGVVTGGAAQGAGGKAVQIIKGRSERNTVNDVSDWSTRNGIVNKRIGGPD